MVAVEKHEVGDRRPGPEETGQIAAEFQHDRIILFQKTPVAAVPVGIPYHQCEAGGPDDVFSFRRVGERADVGQASVRLLHVADVGEPLAV